MFDLNDVRFVKRVVVSNNNPARMLSNTEIEEVQSLLNRCLAETPKRIIIGVERSFTVLQIGERQVVLQWLTYHVGFPRRPVWVKDRRGANAGRDMPDYSFDQFLGSVADALANA